MNWMVIEHYNKYTKDKPMSECYTKKWQLQCNKTDKHNTVRTIV